MSTPQFAPITSSLLARKGDASPSALSVKPSLFWRREDDEAQMAPPFATESVPRVATGGTQPPESGKLHKIMVALTPAEFEKLGIAAVKKGVTRHQIVRNALDLHLDRLKREYGGCGCMATGESTCGGAGCAT